MCGIHSVFFLVQIISQEMPIVCFLFEGKEKQKLHEHRKAVIKLLPFCKFGLFLVKDEKSPDICEKFFFGITEK